MRGRFKDSWERQSLRAARCQEASRMASSHWSQGRGAHRGPPQSPRTSPTNPSISDSQPPELRESPFLRLRVSLVLCSLSPRKLTHPGFIHDPHAPGTPQGPAYSWLPEEQRPGAWRAGRGSILRSLTGPWEWRGWVSVPGKGFHLNLGSLSSCCWAQGTLSHRP